MFNRASAAVCAAAIAGVLLVPAQLSARGGGAGAVGHAGGFPSGMNRGHPPLVRPVQRVNSFVHRRPFAHREFREHRAFRERRESFAARRHQRAIFYWPGADGYGLPVTYGDDGAFYGTYYDPSDVTASIFPPVYAVPPAPVPPGPVPTPTARPDPPGERTACRSQTVALSSPSGAERSVTITRC
jgi:hypothetical protein